MDDEFYKRCYVCFGEDRLIKCHTCVYHICELCVLDEKISCAAPGLCRHGECAYSYLTPEEEAKQNCFVCSEKQVEIEYTCGTCGCRSSLPITKLEGTIKELATPKGQFEKTSDVINQKLIYYTIKNIDTGEINVDHFWEITDQTSNDRRFHSTIIT